MFESDIEEKVQNINLFEVVYKKDSFVLGEKEYPVGYTSYLAIKRECRFIDEKLFKALLDIHDELLDDFIMNFFISMSLYWSIRREGLSRNMNWRITVLMI